MDRRDFLRGLAGLGMASAAGGCRVDTPSGAAAPGREPASRPATGPASAGTTRSRFRIGVESVLPGEGWWATIYGRLLGATYDEDIWARALKELGAEFTLFYDSLSPAKSRACERITDMCRRHGMDFLFNNTYGDIYGPWLPGTGRAEYSDAQLAYAAEAKQFRGIILDEVEHRQIHHMDTGQAAYLADVKGLKLTECYERVLASASAIASRYRKYGGATVAEQVFPGMSHLFARAGIIPAPKLSFSFPPVHFAEAAGAAKQYGTELWLMHDFWGAEPFWGDIAPFAPGFSPEAYRSSLLLAYWLGVDAAYTEALHNLILLAKLTDQERRLMQEHKVPHRPIDQNEWFFVRRFSINAYGKIHRWFAKHYVPSHPRQYTFRDVRPRVAMIRFPDSLWATPDGPRALKFQGLYGPGGPAPDQRHTAWFDAWHVLTYGVVPRDGLSIYASTAMVGWWSERQKRIDEVDEKAGRPIDYPYTERYPFCPADGVVVFDHLVPEEPLIGVDLLILTGETISEATSQAVCRRVQTGADCLTLEHLAPAAIRKQDATCPYEVRAGRGRFLVVIDFKGEASEKFIRRHLGPRDRIRYRFGEQVVSVRPGEGYTSQLINEEDFPATRGS